MASVEDLRHTLGVRPVPAVGCGILRKVIGMDRDRLLEGTFERRDFLKLMGVTGATSLLAACGGNGEEAVGPATGAEAPEARPPIEEESGELRVFEYGGDEVPDLYRPYLDKGFEKPSFAFYATDEEALNKVRAGQRYDVAHPCTVSLGRWVEADLVQPWDTSLLSNFRSLNPEMVTATQVHGQQYMLPVDWGFGAPLYRGDEVAPNDNSWTILYDERYAGKISWLDLTENVVMHGYVLGVPDPWDMTDEELGRVKEELIDRKGVVRRLWASPTDLEADFANGTIWIAYAWPGSWVTLKRQNLDVVYMDPKEGRFAWLCGLVLFKDTENYHHAHEFADAWLSEESAIWELNNYAYGRSTQDLDLGQVDPVLVEAFSLDDPSALEEPRAHIYRPIPRRDLYNQIWEEIKAA